MQSLTPNEEKQGMATSSDEKRALVCEDDAAIRELVTTLLRREKFSVDTAVDGLDAIEKISQNRYQLLVIDLMMPKVSGYAVVEYLKKNIPPSLKRIVVTTAATDAIKNPFPEEICKLLAKPFEIDEFITYARQCSEDTMTRRRRTGNV